MSTPAFPFPTDKGLKKPVCVFCGSSPGSLSLYANAAKAVGRALAENNIPLVYGGGRRGLMGIVSAAALDAGGYVHGIIPRSLIERAAESTLAAAGHPATGSGSGSEGVKSGEGQGSDLLDHDFDGRFTTEVTSGMHERKLKMAKYSTGGFVCLPGGYGTFEEMMEMITWNQLGIHSLPVMVLNIGNFYAPIRTLLEGAVSAGFVQEKNLALLNILDLEKGNAGPKAANLEESIVDQWGAVVVKALEDWTPPNAGYGLKWDPVDESVDTKEEEEKETLKEVEPDFSLFTTMRYTAAQKQKVKQDQIPLWGYHVERLREAHVYFTKRDGGESWGDWPGDEYIWRQVTEKLSQLDEGDYRVRLLLHPGGEIEVQTPPAPPDAGTFQLLPSDDLGNRRPLMLDPHITDLSSESPDETDLRRYKTTNRRIYDQAFARAPNSIPHPEILLRTNSSLLETTTSNIAIQTPGGGWVTPTLSPETPFLNGVMRRYLLDRGVLREGDLSVTDYEEARSEGRRVIGFNGLRGVWEAELI